MTASTDNLVNEARDLAAEDDFERLLGDARALGERVRLQVLRALRSDSYGVLELCTILDIAQPALSHHLRILFEAGLVAKRREGSTIFYRRAAATTAVRKAFFAAIDATHLSPEQQARVQDVYAARARRSLEFFALNAADFATRQGRVAQASVYVPGVLEVLDRALAGAPALSDQSTALEIGPGDGELLRALADRFDVVTGIDNEPSMLERCAPVADSCANVRLLQRDFMALPSIARYRLVVAAMVIHHLAAPARVFQYARRLVVDQGHFLVVELCRHEHTWVHEACGDQWLGFEPQELNEWAEAAGFTREESQFLAQRNGFQIQIHAFRKVAKTTQ